jgi:hypothetical protein
VYQPRSAVLAEPHVVGSGPQPAVLRSNHRHEPHRCRLPAFVSGVHCRPAWWSSNDSFGCRIRAEQSHGPSIRCRTSRSVVRDRFDDVLAHRRGVGVYHDTRAQCSRHLPRSCHVGGSCDVRGTTDLAPGSRTTRNSASGSTLTGFTAPSRRQRAGCRSTPAVG